MNRIKKLQKKLRKMDCLLVSNPLNLNYLTQTAFFSENSRDGFLLIRKKSASLFVSCLISRKFFSDYNFDKIYILQKRNGLIHHLKTIFLSQRPLVLKDSFLLGFEENDLKFFEYQKFSEKLSSTNKKSSEKTYIKLIPAKNLIENLRIIKDKDEIIKIKKACQITRKSFDYIIDQLKPGRSEKQIAWLMEKFMRQNGADGLAFPIIVASGSNSAIPHHQTSNQKIKKNDIVLVDGGCKYQGYCSDITRTFFIGKPKPEWLKVYNIVKEAQQKAIQKVQPSSPNPKVRLNLIRAFQIDKISRDYIGEQGYRRNFIHRTGHGLGLDIHEKPHIDQKSQQTLKAGMVFTIEPGIYLPRKFGIRIEDIVFYD